MKRLLLVDDEKNMLTVLELLFQQAGYQTFTAESAEKALGWLAQTRAHGTSQPLGGTAPMDVVISDLRLPGMDGIRFLRELRRLEIDIPFILITAFGTVDKAVEVMKLGAVDVLTKPFPKEAILETVEQSLMGRRAVPAKPVAGDVPARPVIETGSRMVWESPAMAELVSLVSRVGPVNLPVLITGESGTGKEVVARALHESYGNGKSCCPFVSVNCPAVPENLLESELFGYRKGAFTGANQDFRGKVELADHGTLFFDEIGDLPLSIQPKLLRLLENRTYDALGSGQSRHVDIRIVCATNRDLKTLVREGRFREDLYYRINVFALDLPPLRERPEDILVLADHFLKEGTRRMNIPVTGFAPGVIQAFSAWNWPGNVRELRNVVERALVLATGNMINLADIPFDMKAILTGTPVIQVPPGPEPSLSSLDASERRLILDALECHHGNVSAASRHLGITRNTMRYRMQKHGLVEIHQSEV